MFFTILIMILILLTAYDIYCVQIHNKKSFIIPILKTIYSKLKYAYTLFYNNYIKRYKIIMSDVDLERIRDLNTNDLNTYIIDINNIIRRETAGIPDKIHTYKTNKGRHIIIYLHNSISQKEVIIILEYLNTDPKYIELFKQKGYFSLFQVRRGKQNISELKKYEV
jgi:hypothetical protein